MKKFNYIVAALALLSGAMFSSCVEDKTDLPLHNQHQIDFTASSDMEWQDVTRAAEEEPQVMILEMEGDEDLEQPLYLHITCEDREDPTAEELFGEEATRGNVTTTENFVDKFGTNGFGLFAYVYKPGEWSTAKSDYIHNLPVPYHENTGKWHIVNYSDNAKVSTGYHYWPGKNYNVQFYAYARYVKKGDTEEEEEKNILNIPPDYYDNSGENIDGPSIDFLVSNLNIDQFDFCVAKSGELPGNYNQTLHLNFKHALSAIDFIADEGMPAGTITDIWLADIIRQDKYLFEEERWAGEEQYTGSKNVHFKENYTVKLDGDREQNITGSSTNSTFFVIPHTITSENARIQVHYTDAAGQSHTLKAKLKGTTWEMGKRYIYRLSPNSTAVSYTLAVLKKNEKNAEPGPTKTSDTYLGGGWSEWWIASYKTIASFKSSGTSVRIPVKWKAEFSEKKEDGTWSDWSSEKPAMFLNFNTMGNHQENVLTIDTVKYGTNFAPIIPDDPFNPFGNDIASRPEIPADENPVNLYSKNGNCSANCYVVNAAGTYRFPLVYGNAIKGATANEPAYTGVSETANALSSFPDHMGKAINSPYIPDNYLTNAVAVLLWCDAPQLVTNVSLSTSKMIAASNPVRYIEFTVPKESLTPGNAVIALYDKDPRKKGNEDAVVIWSWHIWVTKWDPATDFVSITSNNKVFTFAKEALGYCPARKATWNERSVKVRFRQDEPNGKVSPEYTFTQTEFSVENNEGNMPYYQWGRKDPLLPYNYYTSASATSTSGKEKACFFASHIPLTSINDMYVWDSTKDASSPEYDYSAYFGITNVAGDNSTIDIKTSIQNPHIFYARHKTEPKSDTSEYDWCNEGRLNRWDANNKSDSASALKDDLSTLKTIYDPCPHGWCVPPSGAWSTIANAGSIGTNASKANAYSAYPYKNDATPAFKITVQSKDFIFPFTGDRNRYNGAPWWDTVDPRCVEYWTATPAQKSTTYPACALFIASGSKKMSNGGALGMCSGFAILPVMEH